MNTTPYPAGLPFTAATVADGPATTDEAYWYGRLVKPISDTLDSYMYGDGYLTDEAAGWTLLNLINSWAAWSPPTGVFFSPAFRTIGDRVELRGLVKDGASGTSFPIADNLPPPATTKRFPLVAAGPGIAEVDLNTAGELSVFAYWAGASNGFISLSGVRYFVN